MKRGAPRTYQNCYGRKTAIKNKSPPIGQLSSNRGGGSEVAAKELELEDKP